MLWPVYYVWYILFSVLVSQCFGFACWNQRGLGCNLRNSILLLLQCLKPNICGIGL